MAPEILGERGYGVQADIWSLGITCIEMAEGNPPHHNVNPMRAIFMIPTQPPPKLSDESKYSPQFVNFLKKCLIKNPDKRPSAQELLKDAFVAGNHGLSVMTDKETLKTKNINPISNLIETMNLQISFHHHNHHL